MTLRSGNLDGCNRRKERTIGGSDLRCPVCGVGVLGDIAYDENPAVRSGLKQAPESREVLTFSCGHEVESHRLLEAARRDTNVERRQSDESLGVVDPEGGSA